MVKHRNVLSFNSKEDYLNYSNGDLAGKEVRYTDDYDNVARGWTFDQSTEIMKMKGNTNYSGYLSPYIGYHSIGDKITISGEFAKLVGKFTIDIKCYLDDTYTSGTFTVPIPQFEVNDLDTFLQKREYTFIVKESGYYRVTIGVNQPESPSECWFRNFAILSETINKPKSEFVELKSMRKYSIRINAGEVTLIDEFNNDDASFTVNNDDTVKLTFDVPLKSNPFVFAQGWYSSAQNYLIKVDYLYTSFINIRVYKYGETTPAPISTMPNLKFQLFVIE